MEIVQNIVKILGVYNTLLLILMKKITLPLIAIFVSKIIIQIWMEFAIWFKTQFPIVSIIWQSLFVWSAILVFISIMMVKDVL